MQTNTNPRKFKVSIWNISEPVADFLFNLSNAVLILGAFLVFTGTIGSIWMQAAKSYFSDERIAANEAATAPAKADAEIAREGAAAAHAKALEAQLALEKYKAPRTLSETQRKSIIEKVALFNGIVFDAGIGPLNDPEPQLFLEALEMLLRDAGWKQVDWQTQPAVLSLGRAGKPSIGSVSVTNVYIEYPSENSYLSSAATALVKSLLNEGIDAAAFPYQGSSDRNYKNNDIIHIMIGRKL
jgi:hypothetical protein